MALNIKNRDVEAILDQVVSLTGESKTDAVRIALEERYRRLSLRLMAQRDDVRLLTFFEDEVWPHVPEEQLGTRLTKDQEEQILGYGELGV
ncbi:MAG: type II toxin-antitoxin system VapB family antitoxin [Anaerolineales bacterium]|nr:type II toxin-antitoxin system VapB family antitoxin [Anaerolineales bacterium]